MSDRTDHYPEVTDEESGLVPPQGHKGEWPKKIRTLTAVELDRLTIDSEGRFYWDGRLVNYQGPEPQAKETEIKPVDLDALAMLDRAAAELSGQNLTEPAASSAHVQPAMQAASIEHYSPTQAPHVVAHHPVAMQAVATPSVIVPDKVRVSLSFWQSLGLLLVIVGILLGVAGLALSGLVAAHDWSCRTGTMKAYCPAQPPPPPAPPPRADIPA